MQASHQSEIIKEAEFVKNVLIKCVRTMGNSKNSIQEIQ